jgi:hypothetical protein
MNEYMVYMVLYKELGGVNDSRSMHVFGILSLVCGLSSFISTLYPSINSSIVDGRVSNGNFVLCKF